MALSADNAYWWNGCMYVPFHTVRLAAGPFLSVSTDSVEQHLKLPPDWHYGVQDRYVHDVRLPRDGLAAARIHGDSMVYRDILDGDVAIFRRSEFDWLENDSVVVIEKVGEEEGFGAWALKKLVIERPRSFHRGDSTDDIDWDDPIFVLHSSNPLISPSRLSPSRQYRVHGIFLRCLRSHQASFVDADTIRRLVTGEQ